MYYLDDWQLLIQFDFISLDHFQRSKSSFRQHLCERPLRVNSSPSLTNKSYHLSGWFWGQSSHSRAESIGRWWPLVGGRRCRSELYSVVQNFIMEDQALNRTAKVRHFRHRNVLNCGTPQSSEQQANSVTLHDKWQVLTLTCHTD